MRKLLIPITMIMLAALFLSACTGAVTPSGTTGTSVPVTGATSGAGTSTVAPTTGVGTSSPLINSTVPSGDAAATADAQSATQTAAAGGVATTAPNASTTSTAPAANNTPSAANATSTVSSGNVGATATVANGGAATTAPTVSTTGTPAAGTSSSGSGTTGAVAPFAQGQLIKLSDILQSTAIGSDKMKLGSVDGLLVERPVLPGEGEPTPEAGKATSTPVPTPSTPQQVFLRYILVNVNNGGTEQAGNVGTTQNGSQIVVPWQAVTGSSSVSSGATGSQTLALNVTANDLASAPHTTLLDVVSGSSAWQTPLASYWSGKGVSIPATGANSAQKTAMIFIPRERGGINITDVKGNAIGQASDLLIDAKTGEIMYVVLPASPFSNNQTVAVPMRLLTWTIGQGAAEITNRGAMVLNFDTSVLKNIPSLGDLNSMLNNPTLMNQLNNFWNSIQGGGTSK